MTNETKTVGELSGQVSQVDMGKQNVIELAREMLTDFDKNVYQSLDTALKQYPNRDIYLVVLHKRERLLPNVIRNFFSFRLSAPTPTPEQTVFKYDHKKQEIEFLWSIPDDETCRIYYNNRSMVDPSDYDILQMVIDFRDGKLYEKALQLNGELP
jgi:hypothetical protein